MNKQIEREEVLNPCKKLCKELKITGYIIKWRRLDALDYYHEDGDPDLEIWVSSHGILIIIMAECKKPLGGVLSQKQKECREKYKVFKNVIYEEITSVNQLKQIITKISENQYFNPESFKEFQELIL